MDSKKKEQRLMSELKPGVRLCSAVCGTEVVVIAAPAGDTAIRCGGALMYVQGDSVAAGDALGADSAQGTELGKRYTDEDATLELLCVKPGEGSLAVAGEPLVIKGAKPLPSSD
ncbi:MAG: hypothetical protein ACI9JM_002243 [Halioglobus sp.]